MRDETCGVGALAVANSYGFLLKRLTLSHHCGCPISRALLREVEPLKLVRKIKCTENFHRCKKNLVVNNERGDQNTSTFPVRPTAAARRASRVINVACSSRANTT
jgi:hypothetical protein